MTMSVGLMIKAEVECDKHTHTVFLDELMDTTKNA